MKKKLNFLHQEMSQEGYNEVYVHQEGLIICVQRHCPETHSSMFLFAHTAFHKDKLSNSSVETCFQIPMQIENPFIANK
jgi:hypothetical protein